MKSSAGPVEPDGSYEVERIIDIRASKARGNEYLIKWRFYEDEHNTWEPEGLLDNCPLVLSAFKKAGGRSLSKRVSPASPSTSLAADVAAKRGKAAHGGKKAAQQEGEGMAAGKAAQLTRAGGGEEAALERTGLSGCRPAGSSRSARRRGCRCPATRRRWRGGCVRAAWACRSSRRCAWRRASSSRAPRRRSRGASATSCCQRREDQSREEQQSSPRRVLPSARRLSLPTAALSPHRRSLPTGRRGGRGGRGQGAGQGGAGRAKQEAAGGGPHGRWASPEVRGQEH